MQQLKMHVLTFSEFRDQVVLEYIKLPGKCT